MLNHKWADRTKLKRKTMSIKFVRRHVFQCFRLIDYKTTEP